jgi:hypothetical protein
VLNVVPPNVVPPNVVPPNVVPPNAALESAVQEALQSNEEVLIFKFQTNDKNIYH